ncbi:hypothetical protein CPC08DRAFT_112418 [Agrocybe pediades]|nr:hypothetical protein CPC08DRAFT_112418 [Agrocybe pediades]
MQRRGCIVSTGSLATVYRKTYTAVQHQPVNNLLEIAHGTIKYTPTHHKTINTITLARTTEQGASSHTLPYSNKRNAQFGKQADIPIRMCVCCPLPPVVRAPISRRCWKPRNGCCVTKYRRRVASMGMGCHPNAFVALLFGIGFSEFDA